MIIKTKLYQYNIDSIRSCGKHEDSINLNYMLGYVDFTDYNIISEMLKHADEIDTNDFETEKDIIINFENYNIKALKQGLKDCNLELNNIEPLKLSKMIAYALGFIDYSLDE